MDRSEAAIAPLNVGGWKPEGVARDAVQALINTLQALGSITIWLVIYFLPILVILAIMLTLAVLVIRFIYRTFFKSRKPQKPAAPPPA